MASNTVRGMHQRDALMILMYLKKNKKYSLNDYLDGGGTRAFFYEVIQFLRDAIDDLKLPFLLESTNNANNYKLFKTTEAFNLEYMYDLDDKVKAKYSLIIIYHMLHRRIKIDMNILRFIIPNKSDKTIQRTMESLKIVYDIVDNGYYIDFKKDNKKGYYLLRKYN